jgi:hypothetical protein
MSKACSTHGGEDECIQDFRRELGKRSSERLRRRWEDNIKTELRETECGGIYWNDLA